MNVKGICGVLATFALSFIASSCQWLARPAATLGYVSTVAGLSGEFAEPFGIAVKGRTIFVSDGQTDRIFRLEGDKAIVFAEGLDTPSGIAFDEKGDLLVADTGADAVISVDRNGKVTTLAKGCAGSRHEILETGAADQTPLNGPIGLAAIGDKVYFTDTYNDRICVIERSGVSTLAGGQNGYRDGGSPTAQFDTPTGIAIWNDKLLVADTGNRRIRVVEPNGDVWTLAGNGNGQLRDGPLTDASLVEPLALAAVGDKIYVADGNAIRRIDFGAESTITTVSNPSRGLADGSVANASFNRPSGLAIDAGGDLFVTDSDNRLIRRISPSNVGTPITPDQIDVLKDKPDTFRNAAPGRWPFDPPLSPRDIAGTLGELRGEVGVSEQLWFHNGLDIAGAYGETARFIRDEKVLLPIAAQNFGTLRELLRMPTLGYIHLRLGRSADDRSFGDPRFQFQVDDSGKISGVRVSRGTRFRAGEAIGTLNAMNHVHLIAGRTGAEMNALDALELPGLTDTKPPVIENVRLADESGVPVETGGGNLRIRLTVRARVVARVYDQMDGGSGRRRLGPYRLGYQVLRDDGSPATVERWTISFALMPSNDAVTLAYAPGSKSGAMIATIFDYVVTNVVNGAEAREGFLDTAELGPGMYTLRVMAADRFENRTEKDIQFEVIK
jgi:sugar lactone lactonase YvrE